jgi:hypothetical protein
MKKLKNIKYSETIYTFAIILLLIIIINIIYKIYKKYNENYIPISSKYKSNIPENINSIHDLNDLQEISQNAIHPKEVDIISKEETDYNYSKTKKLYPYNYKIGPLSCSPVNPECGCIWNNPDVNYYIDER